MSSTRLSEYLDHQALVAKLADTSEQCYKLLQLCNDLEKNLNDHNTDPEAHLDIRKAIEVVSGRLDTANTAFNTHISNIKNTYDAEVAELKKKDTDLENNLGEVSDKLDTVKKGEHVYDNSIKSEVVADDILAAAKGDAIIQSTTDKDGVVMLASLESPSGIYTLGSNHDEFEVNFHSDSDLAKNSPAATQSVVLLDKNGNSKFGKNVSAEQFTGKLVGDVTGNAATATNASKFNGLVASDFARTTGNVNQTITGTKTFKSPIVGNLQGTAGNADKLDNLDSSDFVRKTNNVAETITGNKTFSAIVYGDNFQPKSGNKTGTIGTSDNGYKTIYVEHVEASTIAGNVTGNLTGNADTATKLRTPRKINDTDFDGTSAIVTKIWGTTRNFYIADSTGKHTGIPIGVNGSGTVTLRLPPKIDAETTGNANTATKLATARKINGTDFDGTHDITTAYWGTRRNVYISDSDGTHTGIAVTMDGSGNVTLRLPGVIKADLIGNTTGVASNAENTVLFNGLTTGDFVRTTGNVNQTITGTKTFNSPINSPVTTGAWINGNRGVAIINSTANAGYNVLFRMKSSHGVFTGCAWDQSYQINYTTDSIVNAGTNATTYTNTLIDENGNATFSNNITVRGTINGNLNGNVTGNAATATKLATARSLWGNNFDGSAAITGIISGTPAIELMPAATSNIGGYIDFHYNHSTADYTSRIIESASGTLSINGVTITTGKVVTATTFNGALKGNVTGNCSGSSGSCTGNAATATKLAAKRTIALSGAATGTATGFDGSGSITIPVTALDASKLTGTASVSLVSDLLNHVYPVGSIYMSTVNVSPASFFGGTWQAIEQGRMLMAAGSSWQAGTTGGAVYHTLTVQEMPAHDHSATETAAGGHTHEASTDSAGAHSHSGSTNNAGNHYHTGTTSTSGAHHHGTWGESTEVGGEPPFGYYDSTNNHWGKDGGGLDRDNTLFNTSTDGNHFHSFSTSWKGEHAHSFSTDSAGAHAHSVAIAAAGAHTHAITIGKTGSGAAFSILPPYIAVYMWRRTA